MDLDLNEIIERLADATPKFRAIGGSANLDAIKETTRIAMPACYVLPGAEDAAPNQEGTEGEDSDGFMQIVRVEFSLMLVVSNKADARGKTAHGDLQPVRSAARLRLINWTPTSAMSPVEFARGRAVAQHAGEIWWEDFYRTEFILQPES